MVLWTSHRQLCKGVAGQKGGAVLILRCFWPLALNLAIQICLACMNGARWWSLAVWGVVDLLVLRNEVKLYRLYGQDAKAREEQDRLLEHIRRSESAWLN